MTTIQAHARPTCGHWLSRTWHSLVRFVSGPDLFLSYSRADGAVYAAGLAARLGQRDLDFHCFLDQWDAPPGRRVPRRALRALRRSTMLVVVGTSAAAQSKAVHREILTFRRRKWRIIPICFDGAVESATWFAMVEGLARENEDPAALRSGTPSDHVLNRIERAYAYSKRNRRVRQTLSAAALGLALFMAATVFSFVQSARREKETVAGQLVLDANRIQTEEPPAIQTSVLLAAEAVHRMNDLGVDGGAAIRSLTNGLALLPHLERTFDFAKGPLEVRWLPDHRHVIVIGTNSASLIDLDRTGQVPDTFAQGYESAWPSEDGSVLLVTGPSGAGLWQLPAKKFIRWDSAPAFDVAGLSRDGALIAVGNRTGITTWAPNDPEQKTQQLDLGDFVATHIAVTNLLPNFLPWTVIAASATAPDKAPFSSMVQHRLWVIHPDTKAKQFVDVDYPIAAFASSTSGVRVVTAGKRRGPPRGVNSIPFNITLWTVRQDVYPRTDTISLYPEREASIRRLDNIAMHDSDNAVALVGDGRLETIDSSGFALTIDDATTTDAVLSGDGVLALNNDGTARLYRANSRQEIARIPHGSAVTGAAIDWLNERVITASDDGVLKLWKLSHPLHLDSKKVELETVLALSENHRVAAGQQQGGATGVWLVDDWRNLPLSTPQDFYYSLDVTAYALSKDGSLFAESNGGGWGSTVWLFSTSNGTVQKRVELRDLLITQIAITDKYVLCSGSGRLALIDLKNKHVLWPYGEPLVKGEASSTPESVGSVIIADDASATAVLVAKGRVDVFDVTTQGHRILTIPSEEEPKLFGGIDGIVVTASSGSQIPVLDEHPKTGGWARAWNARTLLPIAEFHLEDGEEVVGLSPDSQHILTRWMDPDIKRPGFFRVVEARNGSELLKTPADIIFPQFAFSRDSRYVATSADDYIRVFDLSRGWQLAGIPTRASFYGIAFDEAANRILTWYHGETESWYWRPADLLNVVCDTVTTNLSPSECQRYMPGRRCSRICPSLK
jgi:WD40 repeat protein